MNRKIRIFIVIWAMLATILAAGLVVFEVIRNFGSINLRSKIVNNAPLAVESEEFTVEEESLQDWQDDWVKYNGEIYDYNDEILTFLVMGIDKDEEIVVKSDTPAGGGQADALFLVVLDPVAKKTKIIGINRNTMADVDVYDENGSYETTITAQIAVQHGFGDGLEKSCLYQKRAVSNMLYDLPIHGYAALNMSAISTITDALGGVTLTPSRDFEMNGYSFKAGEPVTLDGASARVYLSSRNTGQMSSADQRLARQKEFLIAVINKVREEAASDPKLMVDVFKAVTDQMVTDLTIDEVSYLAPYVADFDFDEGSFYIPEGETVMGKKYLEFYPDTDKLYELLLKVFYNKVDISRG